MIAARSAEAARVAHSGAPGSEMVFRDHAAAGIRVPDVRPPFARCLNGKANVPIRSRWRLPALILGATLCTSGCGAETPFEPVNVSPVVQSLLAFPSSIGVGDSAVVVCAATDADGDTLVFDWTSDCRLTKQGQFPDQLTTYNRGNAMVVYPGTCISAPAETGWVSCYARDGRGGGASGGTVRIIIRQ
jgi:hypothetical protein